MELTSVITLLCIASANSFMKVSAVPNEFKIITELILEMDRKPSVTTMLCWNQREIFDLSKYLSFNNIFSNNFVNTSQINIAYDLKSHKCLFLLDLNCNSSVHFLQMSQKNGYFGSPYHWIILAGEHDIQWIQNNLESYDIYVDSEIIVVQQQEEEKFNFFQVYKIGKKEPLIVEWYGKWEEGNIVIDETKSKVTSTKRSNLMGIPLTASYVITDNDTFNHLDDRINPHVDSVTKANYELTMILAEASNFSINRIYTSLWGWADNEGRWSGMMGQLQRGEAELTGTPIFITMERIDMLDFITSTTPDIISFVFRQPPLSYVSNLFTLPFSLTVWQSSGLLLLLFCGVLKICSLWEAQYYQDTENRNDVLKPELSDTALMAIGAVFQQGSHVEFRTISGRLSQLVTLIALMFLFTSYSANIVALLQSTTNSINTLNDLLNSGMECGVEDNIYNRKYFSTVDEPVRKAIYETKIAPPDKPPNFMSIDEGVAKLREGLFAFHMQVGVGYKLMDESYYEHEKCNMQEIHFLEVFQPHLGVPKRSPYREILKVIMKKLHEVGLQSRVISLIYTKKPPCMSKEGSFVSVRLNDCYPALMWYVYGIGCSGVFFLFEWICHIKKKYSCNRNILPEF